MPIPELEPDHRRVNIRDLHYGPVPLGEWLASRTLLSCDSETQKGFERARQVLEERGILVLDAHVTPLDIIATAVGLSEQLELRALVAPVSAYDYLRGFPSKGFLCRLDALWGIELYPVYRSDDLRYPERRGEYQRAVAANRLRKAQVRYLRRAEEALGQPGTVVLVTAYNGANRLGMELAPGVERLLRGAPALLSYSEFERGRMEFRVSLSPELQEFPRDADANDMLTRIYREHHMLMTRADEEVGLSLA